MIYGIKPDHDTTESGVDGTVSGFSPPLKYSSQYQPAEDKPEISPNPAFFCEARGHPRHLLGFVQRSAEYPFTGYVPIP